MLEDYLKEVLAAYAVKRNEGNLSQNLLHPTPGRLRDECLIVYRERSTAQDDSILRLFFSYTDKGYTKGIENFSVDDFRQIPKILNGKVTTPGVKYIDLLAWLIDFNPRPSTLYYKAHRSNTSTNGSENQDTSGKTGDEPDTTDKPNTQDAQIPVNGPDEKGETQANTHFMGNTLALVSNTRQPKLNLAVAITGIVLLLAGIGAFLFWDHFSGAIRMPSPDEKCMYWTGDHYEPIKCNEKVNHVPIVPLDIKRLTFLKKINSFDTLTKNAIGKVWYSSIGGQHEFFTDSGMHPVDTVKRLRPLTSFILTNHISYYRYQLTVLTWSISTIIVMATGAILANYFRRKRKFRRLP